MLVRIVKLTFKKENIASFEAIFENNKKKIRQVEGCTFLELLQSKEDKNVFFTYSYWNSASDLENYRNSEFFKKVWGKTKLLFEEKPEAWSLVKKETIN
ncbi:antibiotic biosynthesis monooxygenase family protein [Arenibacter sp. F20364]|uniref:putative quinol monooxygenase n=1 Tax=Arenibacter sp. F20364 TaxID=2926415 RepID=UPI001FF6A3AD|nr:antibiotic biosynthesis monooxygenase family protein [Arenibacter sp. F20364]MCK0190793.1 antibiotic biosynthesis monooxygenase [Arenibacter sp. F20364]